MARQFVISIGTSSSLERDAITNYLETLNVGWWHWLPYTWLLVDSHNRLKAKEIRDKIDVIAPGVRNLVLQVNGVSWYGFGPSNKTQNMFDWLRNTWSKFSEDDLFP